MSLRKLTCLTPERLEAARRNAQRSTGPRSESGKEKMKMNALKHGCDAAPENEAAVMRALGEDPARYAALKRDLAAAYRPADALLGQLVDDLTKLYWRRDRIERMQTGLMRLALEAVEKRQAERRREIDAATFDPSLAAAMDTELGLPADPSVRLRLLLSLLGVLREQARKRVFSPRQWHQLASYYQGEVGWRPARFRRLLWLFTERAKAEQQGQAAQEAFLSAHFGGSEATVETCYQELLGLLEEEIAGVEEQFEQELEAQEEKEGAERDASLAPAGRTWEMLLRREMALDRSIDRKVKIIMTMRKEQARALAEEGSPPQPEPADRAAQELSKLVGLDGAEVAPTPQTRGSAVAPNFSSAEAGLEGSGTQRESPAEENAAKTSKSAEQSENVIENKGPAFSAEPALQDSPREEAVGVAPVAALSAQGMR